MLLPVPTGVTIGTVIIGGTVVAGIVRAMEGLIACRTDIAAELLEPAAHRKRPMSKICLSFISCCMVALAGPAFAQAQPVRVGGLTCDTGPRVGLVLGSRQNLRCVFRSNATGRHYDYSGTMSRLGLDVGVTGGGRLFWGVFAPTSHVGRGTLRGTYVGASGNASLGIGLGANVLVGGSHRTISLQPLSVEGQVGVNLALGVARLTLR
ncbi:hypothetical protein ABIA96_004832 [Bradyrhizobium sp. LB11.1]